MWRARALPAVPACREPSWCRSFTRVQASFNAKLVLLRLLRSLARSTALRHTRSSRFSPTELLADCDRLHILTRRVLIVLWPAPVSAVLSAVSQALCTVCRLWGFEHLQAVQSFWSAQAHELPHHQGCEIFPARPHLPECFG